MVWKGYQGARWPGESTAMRNYRDSAIPRPHALTRTPRNPHAPPHPPNRQSNRTVWNRNQEKNNEPRPTDQGDTRTTKPKGRNPAQPRNHTSPDTPAPGPQPPPHPGIHPPTLTVWKGYQGIWRAQGIRQGRVSPEFRQSETTRTPPRLLRTTPTLHAKRINRQTHSAKRIPSRSASRRDSRSPETIGIPPFLGHTPSHGFPGTAHAPPHPTNQGRNVQCGRMPPHTGDEWTGRRSNTPIFPTVCLR